MSVTSFIHDSESIDRFVRFGTEVYAGDPKWIPPFESEIRRLLSPEFEFHQTTGNAHRCFLALSDHRTVGRAMACLNSNLKDKDGESVGTIGFFESIADYSVVEDLLDNAIDWLRQQNGVRKIWGPMNFDIWHGYRFMTIGFDQKPFYGEPHNPPFYPEMFARYGFAPKAEWDTVEVNGRETLKKMIARGAERRQYLDERGYRFETFNPKDWDNEVAKLHQVMSKSFSGFLGFTPISHSELLRQLHVARHGIRPEMFIFAKNDLGDLAGFAIGFLELGDAVRSMRGHTDWLARLRFQRQRRHADCVNFYIGGITPEEMARRTGLGRAGFFLVINAVLEAGYDRLMLTLRLKGNAAHALAAHGSPKPQREYALFEVTT